MIGLRLFCSVLAAFVAVAMVGLALARWHFSDGASTGESRIGTADLSALVAELQTRYARRHDWSFVPSDEKQRRDWLRNEYGRTKRTPASEKDGDADATIRVSSTLGDRLGLVDAAGEPLAGHVPGRALIALASIDRRLHPLAVDGRLVGRLVESRADNPADELAVAFLLEQQRNLALIASTGLLSSVLVAAGLAVHFRRPIRRLVAGARELEAGRFDVRLRVDRSDELGRLAAVFNHLATRLESAERMRRRWVADTAHELRTPLAVVRGQIEALQDGVRQPTAEHLAVMSRQILALTRLVDDLGALTLLEPGALAHEPRSIDLWSLIEDVATSFGDKARAAGLWIALGTAPARSTVSGDALRLRQVVNNLLENSVRYTAPGGHIEIDGWIAGQELNLSIADSLPGVPGSVLARLGERFFRIEASRSRAAGGSGLGLSLCKRLIEAHDGRIAFESSVLGGLRVVIVLPLEA